MIELLEGRAERISVSLAGFTVASERAAEIPSALAELVELAEAEIDRVERRAPIEPEPPASRGEILERISGYAERLLQELESRSDIDVVEDELFQVARASSSRAGISARSSAMAISSTRDGPRSSMTCSPEPSTKRRCVSCAT